jgi:hypothetical protein
LAYIFIQLQGYLDVRMLVGLLLKNNVKVRLACATKKGDAKAKGGED